MTKRKLFKELNDLCRELSSEYDINYGGCCYVAAVIAEQLENCNIPFKVGYIDEFSTHYAIKVSDRYINRDNFVFYKDPYFKLENYTSSDLYDIYYHEEWNECYSTENNSIVREKIISIFKKYENNRT